MSHTPHPSEPERPSSPVPEIPDQSVPETIVGQLTDPPAPTQRSSGASVIDHVYDFHPGRVAVRVDGPDVMAVACDDLVEFTMAELVTLEGTTELDNASDMFVGTHGGQPVFRIVLRTADESKRYSTGWIQR